jgi:hypothetical protein
MRGDVPVEGNRLERELAAHLRAPLLPDAPGLDARRLGADAGAFVHGDRADRSPGEMPGDGEAGDARADDRNLGGLSHQAHATSAEIPMVVQYFA